MDNSFIPRYTICDTLYYILDKTVFKTGEMYTVIILLKRQKPIWKKQKPTMQYDSDPGLSNQYWYDSDINFTRQNIWDFLRYFLHQSIKTTGPVIHS